MVDISSVDSWTQYCQQVVLHLLRCNSVYLLEANGCCQVNVGDMFLYVSKWYLILYVLMMITQNGDGMFDLQTLLLGVMSMSRIIPNVLCRISEKFCFVDTFERDVMIQWFHSKIVVQFVHVLTLSEKTDRNQRVLKQYCITCNKVNCKVSWYYGNK